MPSIAQQDYKIIAPKQGRSFAEDAAALGELKKAILNGIGFDCIIKDTVAGDGDFNRVLGFYPGGELADVWSVTDSVKLTIAMPHTVIQYQGLAAVQEAIDEYDGTLLEKVPAFAGIYVDGIEKSVLVSDDMGYYICVDGKYLIITFDYATDFIISFEKAESGPAEGFVNITWEDAQKLIGLPLT